MLEILTQSLHQSLGLLYKRDIQPIAHQFKQLQITAEPHGVSAHGVSAMIPLGDDCAAIPDGDGYLLLAAEGMLPRFVEDDPWFAGWSAVLVNVSDIYAMGGRPLAVVDSLWHRDVATDLRQALLDGLQAAALTYQVPIVGGHTNGHSPYNALSVAILGRAKALLSSFSARSGDRLLVAIDLRGTFHPHSPFWNAFADAPPERLRGDLALLPRLAETGLCAAAKDISMGGIIGTTLMLLETSHCGAVLDLGAIPQPPGVPLEHWLVSFPSYGFLLSVHPERVAAVQTLFRERHLVCAEIGEVQPHHQLTLTYQGESSLLWDLAQTPLTGFAPR